ncbi:MAG: type II/IV secretion system protein [Leptolyngbya sp. PLA2]|nr:type II/IV secretion system protein [Leptolyngbya sp. PL-A2]MCQ3940222.1 type II/IV secretion system protein [cyanobacterium CYA1]MCZ7632653.1 GspE/PulE family protein [Phycisphaerales bacterium]MDL1904040.1 type II/IV secretion system protein [Synechococcales cyanobacterium CNB]GIK20209.1 MAG: general secretion pathway protein GspE [Planctomycetota bacterium]
MGIGTVLLERGLISRAQLEQALAEHRDTGERLDRVLVRLGLVTREQVLQAIGDQFHLPVVDLASVVVEPKVLECLPAKLVYRQSCVPIARENGTLTVATSDPFELAVLDELRLLTGCQIDLVLADEDDLRKFIRANYGVGGDTLDEMSAGLAGKAAEAAPGTAEELEQAQEASVIKLVNDILVEAVTERATDVHVEPYEGKLLVRYRIDGVLQRANVPATIHRFGPAIISRLKIMANLNIAEKRTPQDGRITFRHRAEGGPVQEYDLRVSVIPMLFGEGVVLRVLNKSAVLMSLDDLGMPRAVLEPWDRLIARPHGILLVTGPTGSGKSTTLYASLNRIVSDEIKVITVEDPVEYHVGGVNQIQVHSKIGMTFAAGLRAVLRHDPDVVMIGEIRDRETAEVAVQASLTGHLVFSTLHTNDAAGATTRLLDMGVEPFLVSSSVEGVMAQRLVRRVCEECRVEYKPDLGDLPEDFGLGRGEVLVRGEGCRACRGTGYRGRVGVYELLRMNPAIREMVMQRVNAPQIAARAIEDGDLFTLKQDGYDKARAGVTTIAEVMRALAV